MLAKRPSRADVPPAVPDLVGGEPVDAVWENELGGLTFAWSGIAGRRFVKWTPAGSGIDPADEIERLRWAAPFTPVPRVLAQGGDAMGSWFVTEALPGDNAVTDRWRADPEPAVVAVGQGLRALHDSLPVPTCPFAWSAEERLARVSERAARGEIDPRAWHSDHTGLTVGAALERLLDVPPVDRLVVCHGDACAPNTLLDAGGRWTGHVDLGALGVGDR